MSVQLIKEVQTQELMSLYHQMERMLSSFRLNVATGNLSSCALLEAA